jgi:hypothetical protein
MSMDSSSIVQASLFAQLQPHVLSKQEACLFGSVKAEYFRIRDLLTSAWYRNPTKYLYFDECMNIEECKGLDQGLAWRAYSFLVKNGYINAGLVHAQEEILAKHRSSSHEQRVQPVSNISV